MPSGKAADPVKENSAVYHTLMPCSSGVVQYIYCKLYSLNQSQSSRPVVENIFEVNKNIGFSKLISGA